MTRWAKGNGVWTRDDGATVKRNGNSLWWYAIHPSGRSMKRKLWDRPSVKTFTPRFTTARGAAEFADGDEVWPDETTTNQEGATK